MIDREVRREDEGEGAGLSFLGDADRPSWLPIKKQNSSTNCVFSLTPPGAACHSTRQSHHVCPLLLPVCLSFPLWLTFSSLLCLRPVDYQHVAHVLDKPRGSFTIGVGRQPQPCSPFSSLVPFPASSRRPSFTLPLLILSCRGKRGPEESNNCDSGAFLALFLKLCRHTQGCLLALMKG